MAEEEPAHQLGFREHIAGGLTSTTRAVIMAAIPHCLWLSFGNSLYARMVMKTFGQSEGVGGVISTDNGSAATIDPTARPR